MTTDPIRDNQAFSGVSNVTEQLSIGDIVNAKFISLSNELINTNFIWLNPSLLGKKLYSISGNTSNSFLGLPDGSTQFLNLEPNKPASLTQGGGLLVLPRGATIIGAYALDKDLDGPTNVDIGTAAITGSAATLSSNIFSGATLSNINNGVMVSSQPAYNGNSVPGGTGIPVTSGTLSVSISGATGVTITPTGGDVTDTSGMVVTIYYYA